MMTKKLTSIELTDLLDSFNQYYSNVIENATEDELLKIQNFNNQITLMIPCYSLRPDKLLELNNSIFNDQVITQLILDVSFKFFTRAGSTDDWFERLVCNLECGLGIDGPDTSKNIIPKTIAQSCATNIFNVFELPNTLWNKYIRPKPVENIKDFLTNNKHIVVIYLIYLNGT